MDDQQNSYIKGIMEALFLTTEKPLTLDQIKEIIEGVNASEIRDAIMGLKKDYEERKSGMVIMEIAEGYQMLTNPDYAMYIKKFYRTKHKERLSKPALETLAIIAYKQPVSRMDIELIRGVNSDGVVLHLIAKELIKICGRKDVPGRPYLYETTKQFLEYFGLKSLDDLPKLEDFSSLEQLEEKQAEPSENPSEVQQPPASGESHEPQETAPNN